MKPTAPQPLLDDSSVFGWSLDEADALNERGDRVALLVMQNAVLAGNLAVLFRRLQAAEAFARQARKRERLMRIAAVVALLVSAAMVLLMGGH